MKKLRVGIAGFRGYAGEELVKLLSRHSFAEIQKLYTTGRTAKGSVPLRFSKALARKIQTLPKKNAGLGLDLLFTATPPGIAGKLFRYSLGPSCRGIDLSADYRLPAGLYRKTYGEKSPDSRGLQKAVYGLSEWARADIKSAKIVANPGCYPTAALLLLLPLMREKLLKGTPAILDAKSGVSGAGRKLETDYLYSEMGQDFRAYGIPRHRHAPEIEYQASRLGSGGLKLVFVPHLLPIHRGLSITAYLDLKKGVGIPAIMRAWNRAYAKEPLVKILDQGRVPRLAEVQNGNQCMLSVGMIAHGKAVLFSALDNLGKGAAGQAIQNMNIMFGFPETEGLL